MNIILDRNQAINSLKCAKIDSFLRLLIRAYLTINPKRYIRFSCYPVIKTFSCPCKWYCSLTQLFSFPFFYGFALRPDVCGDQTVNGESLINNCNDIFWYMAIKFTKEPRLKRAMQHHFIKLYVPLCKTVTQTAKISLAEQCIHNAAVLQREKIQLSPVPSHPADIASLSYPLFVFSKVKQWRFICWSLPIEKSFSCQRAMTA